MKPLFYDSLHGDINKADTETLMGWRDVISAEIMRPTLKTVALQDRDHKLQVRLQELRTTVIGRQEPLVIYDKDGNRWEQLPLL
jgi:hypothetical protein